MPNYKESSLTGTAHVRAHRVLCLNPLEGAKTVIFEEERVTVLSDGRKVQESAGDPLRESAVDMAAEFPLLNPADDSVIGAMSYGQLYAALYSLHRFLALRRDTAPEVAPE